MFSMNTRTRVGDTFCILCCFAQSKYRVCTSCCFEQHKRINKLTIIKFVLFLTSSTKVYFSLHEPFYNTSRKLKILLTIAFVWFTTILGPCAAKQSTASFLLFHSIYSIKGGHFGYSEFTRKQQQQPE